MAPDDYLSDFEAMVLACDWDAIESWRPRVKPHHLPALVALYDRATTWDVRCALLQLVQDHATDEVRRRHHHFLAAPNDDRDENVLLTKATGICALERDFTRFTTYYNDRTLLRRQIAAWREKTP